MTEPTREKFATQVKSETLATLRSLAKIEGRQLQALVEAQARSPARACHGGL